ncbi:MAG: hypothetical protein ACP5NX_04390, partial [Candidatus Bilamarchaeaceae archaeon]
YSKYHRPFSCEVVAEPRRFFVDPEDAARAKALKEEFSREFVRVSADYLKMVLNCFSNCFHTKDGKTYAEVFLPNGERADLPIHIGPRGRRYARHSDIAAMKETYLGAFGKEIQVYKLAKSLGLKQGRVFSLLYKWESDPPTIDGRLYGFKLNKVSHNCTCVPVSVSEAILRNMEIEKLRDAGVISCMNVILHSIVSSKRYMDLGRKLKEIVRERGRDEEPLTGVKTDMVVGPPDFALPVRTYRNGSKDVCYGYTRYAEFYAALAYLHAGDKEIARKKLVRLFETDDEATKGLVRNMARAFNLKLYP